MAARAGILFRSHGGRVLLLQRVDDATWDFPTATVADGEDAEAAALRASVEATGYTAGYTQGLHVRALVNGQVVAINLRELEDEFVPRLTNRHVGYLWATPERVLEKDGR